MSRISDDLIDLQGCDLNLLVVFVVLMRERNVTRTAEHLSMSQAAVSAALGRLRKVFEDPLFVRAPGGMAPSAKAQRLEAPIRRGLDTLKIAIADETEFDPLKDNAIFRLGMSDDLEAMLMPSLIETVSQKNPGSSVFCLQANRKTVARLLDSGRISVGVAASSPWGPEIRSRTLFESGYACVYNAERLGRTGPLTKSDYIEFPHIMISADGTRGVVDDVLEGENLTRRRMASTAHFAMLPLLLARTAAIATVPRHAAQAFAEQTRLEICDPPVNMPRFSVDVIWHESDVSEPRVAWMVQTLCEIVRERVLFAEAAAGSTTSLINTPGDTE